MVVDGYEDSGIPQLITTSKLFVGSVNIWISSGPIWVNFTRCYKVTFHQIPIEIYVEAGQLYSGHRLKADIDTRERGSSGHSLPAIQPGFQISYVTNAIQPIITTS